MERQSFQPTHLWRKDKDFLAQDHERFHALPEHVQGYVQATDQRQEATLTDEQQLALCRQQLAHLQQMEPKDYTALAGYTQWRVEQQQEVARRHQSQLPKEGVIYEMHPAKTTDNQSYLQTYQSRPLRANVHQRRG